MQRYFNERRFFWTNWIFWNRIREQAAVLLKRFYTLLLKHFRARRELYKHRGNTKVRERCSYTSFNYIKLVSIFSKSNSVCYHPMFSFTANLNRWFHIFKPKSKFFSPIKELLSKKITFVGIQKSLTRSPTWRRQTIRFGCMLSRGQKLCHIHSYSNSLKWQNSVDWSRKRFRTLL